MTDDEIIDDTLMTDIMLGDDDAGHVDCGCGRHHHYHRNCACSDFDLTSPCHVI